MEGSSSQTEGLPSVFLTRGGKKLIITIGTLVVLGALLLVALGMHKLNIGLSELYMDF